MNSNICRQTKSNVSTKVCTMFEDGCIKLSADKYQQTESIHMFGQLCSIVCIRVELLCLQTDLFKCLQADVLNFWQRDFRVHVRTDVIYSNVRREKY